jgi:hypothetical protein
MAANERPVSEPDRSRLSPIPEDTRVNAMPGELNKIRHINSARYRYLLFDLIPDFFITVFDFQL